MCACVRVAGRAGVTEPPCARSAPALVGACSPAGRPYDADGMWRPLTAGRREHAWPCLAVRGPAVVCGDSLHAALHQAFPVGRAGCAAGAPPASSRCTTPRASSRQAAARSAQTTAALLPALRRYAVLAATAALRAPLRRRSSTSATQRGPSSGTVGATRGISVGGPSR